MTDQGQADEVLQQDLTPKVDVPKLVGHILCADDNEDNRQLVAYLVAKTGAQLTLVEDGQQALNAIKKGTFDLVLMDMQMPEMDGLQATTILQQQNFQAPIVMLTANVDSNSKKNMLAAGAKAHFAKPIDSQRFYAMVVEYLCAKTDDKKSDNVISDNKFLIKLPNTHTEFDQLIQNYRLSFKEKLADIHAAVKQQDWAQVKSLMHKLKGSAGSYGFQQLSDFAILIENYLDQGDLSEAKGYIVDMQKCMHKLYNETEQPLATKPKRNDE
jgi:CheY-like chemotaxis protein